MAVCRKCEFVNENDFEKFSRQYFEDSYNNGERQIIIEVSHEPLKIITSEKHSRVTVDLFEEEGTGRPRARVLWENIPDEVWEETH